MWWTPQGERVLLGAERELVRFALQSIVARWEEESQDPELDRWEWGVALFDGLTPEQQVGQLAATAAALFDPAVPRPKLTGVNEASAGVLYVAAEQATEFEIDVEEHVQRDSHDAFAWRRRIRACFDEEEFAAEGMTLLPIESRDFDEWRELIEYVSDRLFWDDDWSAVSFIMDVDPETSRQRKRDMGIDEDYYTAIAPEYSPAELAKAWEALRAYCTE